MSIMNIQTWKDLLLQFYCRSWEFLSQWLLLPGDSWFLASFPHNVSLGLFTASTSLSMTKSISQTPKSTFPLAASWLHKPLNGNQFFLNLKFCCHLMAVRMNMHPTNLSFKDFFKKGTTGQHTIRTTCALRMCSRVAWFRVRWFPGSYTMGWEHKNKAVWMWPQAHFL